MEVGALEPLLVFLAADRPFAEVSRLAVLSKTWRRVSLNALKTAPQLILGGFAESVTDEVVRLALFRVASEHLKRVDLSGCHNISAGGMEYILQYIAETCSVVKEVDVTACSNEAVLRALAIRAPVVCRVHSPQTMLTSALQLIKLSQPQKDEFAQVIKQLCILTQDVVQEGEYKDQKIIKMKTLTEGVP